jgi:hypothetical protein
MMNDIARSQHSVAKKWQWVGLILILSIVVYFIHVPFLGAYTFGGDANGYAYFGFFLTIFGIVIYFVTYGALLAKTGWAFVISIAIPIVGLTNQIILTALIIDSKNNDWVDIFDCPMYGDIPSGVLVLLFSLSYIMPSVYLAAMLLAKTKWMDPKQIYDQDQENGAAVVIQNVNSTNVAHMDPHQHMYRNQVNMQINPNGPQMYPNQPAVLIMEPVPSYPPQNYPQQPNYHSQAQPVPTGSPLYISAGPDAPQIGSAQMKNSNQGYEV